MMTLERTFLFNPVMTQKLGNLTANDKFLTASYSVVSHIGYLGMSYNRTGSLEVDHNDACVMVLPFEWYCTSKAYTYLYNAF
jgi:hypothetical protein